MHTFWLDRTAQPGDRVPLADAEAAHALRVLRLCEGDEICVVDRDGRRFSARLSPAEGGAAALVGAELASNEAPVRVTLYMGVPKADKLELVVQKATELGAAAIVPVWRERCVVKPERQDGGRRRERLERIAREAVKQCRRSACPAIGEALHWQELLERAAGHGLLMVPWELAEGLRMRGVYEKAPEARDIALLIGPEGGIDPQEAAALQAAGASLITLGPRILRAETAAVAVLTMAMQLWGDL